MPWGKCVPVYDEKVIGLCGTAYHAHPKGCHNFCNRSSCPPTMQPLSICLDDFYLIWIKFPIGEFVKEKLRVHPDWSIYQARNILYWQPKARKELQNEVDEFLAAVHGYSVLGRVDHLDSWGIDMRATIEQLGIKLRFGGDWANHKWTYVLRYAGQPLKECRPKRLKRLIKSYPAIYQPRMGKCSTCVYRPCLRYMASNASLYVGHKIGGFKLERLLEGNQWLLRHDCGKAKTHNIEKPLCESLSCVCQRKKPTS